METKAFDFRVGKITFRIFQTEGITVAKPYQQHNGKMVVSDAFFGKTELSENDNYNSRTGVRMAIHKCLKMMSKTIIAEHTIQIRKVNAQYQEMLQMLDTKINRLEREQTKDDCKIVEVN